MMKIELSVPGSWREVTLPQLRILAEHSLIGLTREVSELVLLCKLAGLTVVPSPTPDGESLNGILKCRDAQGHEFELEGWQLADFCKRLAWFYDEMPFDIVCPVSVNPHLLSTSFGDYFHADALMFGFSTTNDIDLVRQAMADLGDKRKTITAVDAMMMQLWWRGFKQWLFNEYPFVFEGSKDTVDETYSPLKARQNIMLILNEGHPQDNDAIEQSNMHDVLSALQHQIEIAKKEEEMMRKYKS